MPEPSVAIPAEEFATRRSAAADRARAADLDGLLICARGGGTVDRYGDVMYLSNFYTSFPYTPDHAGHWNGRAHGFIILPVNGAPTLITDVPDDGRIRFDDGEIIYTDFVLDATVEALERAGLARARVGLVGTDVIPLSFHNHIVGALPNLHLSPADTILTDLRKIKSPAEIEMLRQASRIGSGMIDAMMAAVAPGATHGEIVAAGMAELAPQGGILYNSFMAHGHDGDPPHYVRMNFPTWSSPNRLVEGDWFRLGVSGMVGGYVFDLSRARSIGRATNRQVDIFEAAISCVEAGIEAVRPGATAGSLAEAGLGRQRELGFPMDGVFSGMGHGVGLGWDAPWLTPDEPTEITPGMVLCFERTVRRGGLLGDFEETVLVTETGVERLTTARRRYW
ncbi:MAG: M24 family metallopeptidase [Pikeienuella sp.]